VAKFLTAQELYRLLQREYPPHAYPDGSPGTFYSTASAYAKSQVLASAYENLETIYDNLFPQTAEAQLDEWEIKVFGKLSVNLTTEERRQRLLAKLRNQKKINLWKVLITVLGFLPEGTYVQISEWGNFYSDGGWVIGVSQLGLNTRFAHANGFGYTLDAVESGVGPATPSDLVEAMVNAYTYEIRIFSAVSDSTLEEIELAVLETEPARSVHYTFSGLSLSDYNLTETVSDVDESSLINCACVDAASSTGYTGKRAV